MVNFIAILWYEIDSFAETCSEFPYKKIGCYEQPNYDARNAAFYTIMTPSSMRSWGDYLSGLVCQCSAAAKYKGHLFFGVKYHNPDDPAGYKGGWGYSFIRCWILKIWDENGSDDDYDQVRDMAYGIVW